MTVSGELRDWLDNRKSKKVDTGLNVEFNN
jgi:hypothetical protein